MRSFIKNITGADERLILGARLHWIYIAEGVIWGVAMAAIGSWLDHTLWKYFGSAAPRAGTSFLGLWIGAKTPVLTLLFGGGGAVIFLACLFKMVGTEIALTSQRLIYKTGLFFVDVQEIDLVEIREETVHHGMLGRFLDYGWLKLDSRFVGDITLPAVAHPYRLVKALHAARGHIHDPMMDKAPPAEAVPAAAATTGDAPP
jgi:hypothetical protein